ncbi:MAG: PP2C family protein-serine/threonine phosphatase [Acidimicrobiales bacterium]
MSPDAAEPISRLHRLLDAAPPYALVDETARFLAAELRATDVALLLADYSGTTLERLPAGAGPDEVESVRVSGSAAGEVHITQRLVVAAGPTPRSSWIGAPVSVRSDRLGVLEAVLADPVQDGALALFGEAAHVLGSSILAAQSYTDLFHRVRRRQELTLAAELQWQLLPVLACQGADFALAGALEPAYDMGGDSFDYAIDADRLSIAILDGMGHGLSAALLATVALASIRNARIWGYELAEQARSASHALLDQYGGDQFVTALLIEVDRPGGEVRIVNAGHPPPVLIRGGRSESLVVPPGYPLGLWPDHEYQVHHFSLSSGDRLVLISDGVVEATPSGGEPYGLDRLAGLLSGDLTARPPTDVARAVAQAVLDHRADVLRDDTTTVCLDWLGKA